MDKLYIVIPAYNEEENIEDVIAGWHKVIEKMSKDSRLVIIDDGSKDNTFSIMKKLEKKYKKLIPITKKNQGHGATVLYGYNYALKNNCNYVFQTDSDGQTNPEEFWDFWEERKNYDMIIGYRKKRQDGSSRVLVTKTLKFILFMIFHVSVKDANTPFRLMKCSTLRKKIKLIPKDYHLSNVILSVIYAKYKLKVKYIDITFKPRQGGVNSINIKKIFKIGLNSLKDFYRINKEINRNIKKETSK